MVDMYVDDAMIFTKSKITISVLFVFLVMVVWIVTPSYVCGIKCNPQWWLALTEMTSLDHMVLEAAEWCRGNPQLVLELESQDICELNYDLEKKIIDAY